MDLIDIKKEKLVEVGDWLAWAREGRVMGLCAYMHGNDDRAIKFIYKIHTSGFNVGHFGYLKSYWHSKKSTWKAEN